MSEDLARAVEGRQVEELTRINAALAAEVRSLALGRIDAPRSSSMPTSRRLAKLLDERETLSDDLDETRAGLKAMTASRDELARHNQELLAEVAKLRSGFAGLGRRARARLHGLRVGARR
jgi:cell division protein FtsB